jgi:hypothetical protein
MLPSTPTMADAGPMLPAGTALELTGASSTLSSGSWDRSEAEPPLPSMIEFLAWESALPTFCQNLA